MSKLSRRVVYAALYCAPPLAIPGAALVLTRHGLLARGESDWGQILYTAIAVAILASAHLAIGRVKALGREWELTSVRGARAGARSPSRTKTTDVA